MLMPLLNKALPNDIEWVVMLFKNALNSEKRYTKQKQDISN